MVGNVVFASRSGRRWSARSRRYRAALRGHAGARARGRGALVLAALVLVAAAAAPRAAAAVPAARARWLEQAQNADGGFGAAPGQRSSGLHTGWAALGLAAAGRNPLDVRARRRRRRRLPARPPARRSADLGEIDAHDPRPARGRPARRGSAAATSSRELLAQAARDGRLRRPRQHDRVRGPRPARGRALAQRPRGAARRALDRRPGQRRRRLQLRRQGRAVGDRRHERGAAGAGRRRPPRHAAVRRAARFLARRQNPDGGFPLSPAAPPTPSRPRGRCRGSSPPAATRTPAPQAARARRSATCARYRAERRRPLLPHEHADAGLGHRAGAHGARAQAVPARAGAAREARRARRAERRRLRRSGPHPSRARPARSPPRRRWRPARPALRPRRSGAGIQSSARIAGYVVGALFA